MLQTAKLLGDLETTVRGAQAGLCAEHLPGAEPPRSGARMGRPGIGAELEPARDTARSGVAPKSSAWPSAVSSRF